MLSSRSFLPGWLLLIVLAISACGSDGSDTTGSVVTTPDLAAGQTLYMTHCASCHGSDLRGTNQGPSHLSEVYEPGHHSDAAFLLAVRVGTPEHHWRFGAMKPIEGLSEDDVAAITAFVREQQRIHGFEPYPP